MMLSKVERQPTCRTFRNSSEYLTEPYILAGALVDGVVLDPFFGSGVYKNCKESIKRRETGANKFFVAAVQYDSLGAANQANIAHPN